METWRIIPGYESYEVSNLGQVRSIVFKNGTTCRPRKEPLYISKFKEKNGYIAVHLPKDGYTTIKRIHQLVLLAFIGPANGLECSHLDGNPENNKLENLKYESHLDNNRRKIIHGTSLVGENHNLAKLNNQKVIEIRDKYKLMSRKLLAKEYGVSRATIDNIINRKNWKHI